MQDWAAERGECNRKPRGTNKGIRGSGLEASGFIPRVVIVIHSFIHSYGRFAVFQMRFILFIFELMHYIMILILRPQTNETCGSFIARTKSKAIVIVNEQWSEGLGIHAVLAQKLTWSGFSSTFKAVFYWLH